MSLQRRRKVWLGILVALAFVLAFSIAEALVIGYSKIPSYAVFSIVLEKIPLLSSLASESFPPSWETIVVQIRLPRIVLGAVVGAALAAAGTSMQGLFRNPMADPFIIGISSGAALGAASTIILGMIVLRIDPGYTVQLMAFVGALSAVLLVYSVAKMDHRIPVQTLLLAGIAVASFLSALTSFLIYLYARDVFSVLFWLIGSLGASKWDDVATVSPIIVIGALVLTLYARDLNSILLGEETARHLGVEVERVKKLILVVSSLVTAAAVSVSGIIGFVGLIIPHIMRLIVGPDHRILLPSSALVGGIFLIWCDVIARMVVAPAELPIGIITSLFGAPFFIYLLYRQKKAMW